MFMHGAQQAFCREQTSYVEFRALLPSTETPQGSSCRDPGNWTSNKSAGRARDRRLLVEAPLPPAGKESHVVDQELLSLPQRHLH